jgi:hypothetical protein
VRRSVAANAPVLEPVPWHVDLDAAAPADMLLWLCGQVALTSDELNRLADVCSNWTADNWSALCAVAEVHGMAPLVFNRLAQTGMLSRVPPAAAESLAASYRATWIHNRQLRGEQTAIITALAAQGVEVMVVKGVALAARYYAELALRPVSDIDLLVRHGDVEQCGVVLRELGYRVVLGTDDPLGFNALMYRTRVYRKAPGFVVEVHWELSGLPTYLPRFSVASPWMRSGSGPTRSRWVAMRFAIWPPGTSCAI